MSHRIDASSVRYIKLGEGGAWAAECIANGTLKIGFGTEKYSDLCEKGQWPELAAAFSADGHSKSTASRFVGEVKTFYEDDGTILWITFHNLRLYWAQIDSSTPASPAADGDGTFRKTKTGCSSHSLGGEELFTANLSGRLTKTASYRGTSCGIDDPEYVVRRINGERRPEVVEAERLSDALKTTVTQMMRLLTPQDFELLVDLIFSSSGWRRLGVVGKTQRTVDLELELPLSLSTQIEGTSRVF